MKIFGLKNNSLDGFIVTNPFNIFYLCSFKGISPTEREGILVFNPKPTLITTKLYQQEAMTLSKKGLGVKIASERDQISKFIIELLKNCKSVGFEEDNLSFSEYKAFKKSLKKVKLVPKKGLVENLRKIKNAEEIKKIEKAQIISQKAFEIISKTIKIGQTEKEISHRLSVIIEKLGADGLAFESIVAAGPNSGFPHHLTGKTKIKKGDILLFDFGAKYQDYCADLTRVVSIGKASATTQNVFNLVKKAQDTAIKNIKSGTLESKAHMYSAAVFEKENLYDHFIHGLGHGVGLEVHELPHLRKTGKEKLLKNMVFSVEPGLYFNWGGIRLEDLVVIENGKARVLGKVQQKLLVV